MFGARRLPQVAAAAAVALVLAASGAADAQVLNITSNGSLGAVSWTDGYYRYIFNTDAMTIDIDTSHGGYVVGAACPPGTYNPVGTPPVDPDGCARLVSQPSGPDVVVFDFTTAYIGGVSVWVRGSRPAAIAATGTVTIEGYVYVENGYAGGPSTTPCPATGCGVGIAGSGPGPGAGGAGPGYYVTEPGPVYTPLTGGGGGGGGGAVSGATGAPTRSIVDINSVTHQQPGGAGGAGYLAVPGMVRGGSGGGSGGDRPMWGGPSTYGGRPGGAGGGAVIIDTPTTLVISGILNADGKPGANSNDGGGGGGFIALQVDKGILLASSATLSARGGAGGAGPGGAYAYSYGGEGGGGLIYIQTSAFQRLGAIDVAGNGTGTVTVVGTDDDDTDGLPDNWEISLGLNDSTGSGDEGPNGDPDVDGRTNFQELADGTHPRGFHTRYFAEGATGALFDYWVALLNPGTTAAHVNLRFLKLVGGPVSHVVAVPGMSRRTVVAKQVPGVEDASAVSTVVESDVQIVADRTMSWDANAYGAHAETSIASPAVTWYLAEGATHSGFDLFYLIQNPNPTAVTVRVTYLRPSPLPPIVKDYGVAANSRFNIWVDLEEFPAGSGSRALAETDVSAILESTDAAKPIIVERAMYLSLGQSGQPGYEFFGAGHDSAGVTAPATDWFLAEGATGDYFDLYILLANPGAVVANVTIRYLLPNGTTVQLPYTVAGSSRRTIFVNAEHPALMNTPVSAVVSSDQPIIVERAMWWPGPTWATWFEAHNSPGALVTGTKWAVADVEHSGTKGTETYILIANTSPYAGQARVTLVFEDGSPPQELPLVDLPANSRTTTYWLKTGGARQRFSAIVESVGATPAQIVVERAMYWDALGVHWAAGTNALGTRLQ